MFIHNRSAIDLSGTWKFNPDPYQRCRQQKWWLGEGPDDRFFPCFNLDGLWDITVPGTWKCQVEELKWYDGHANYVLEFDLPAIPPNHEAFLCFDGVTYRSEVYLNGLHAGNHEWGYSPFQLRVTGMLRRRNRLFVLVDNLMREDRVPGIRCDWNNDGGITGPVKLVFVPTTYLANFRTETRLDGDEVVIQIDAWLASRDTKATETVTFAIPELGVETTFEAAAGRQATAFLRLPRADIALWTPASPKLYETVLSTRHETLTDRLGYREIRTEGTTILLNGEPLRLYGIAVHSEFPGTGRTATDEGIAAMLEKARGLGCNFLRCAHYPYSDRFARAMDEAGMLWWEEVPVYWLPEVHKEPQRSLALGMLREMIVRDWNRASLIFWSVSNECGCGIESGGHDLASGNYPYWVEAVRLVRNLDPGRLVSSADSGHRRTLAAAWNPAAGDTFDELDQDRWLPGHPDAFYDLLDVLGANLYVTAPGGNPLATDRFVEMLRAYRKPLMITEFGSMSTTAAECGRPTDICGHPQRHETILREAYEAFHHHPEIVGYVPWSLMDIRVPMHWRWYNRGSATFAYGLLDNDYREKHVYHVVREEIARLKAALGQSQDARPR